jgi:hypothetical protein
MTDSYIACAAGIIVTIIVVAFVLALLINRKALVKHKIPQLLFLLFTPKAISKLFSNFHRTRKNAVLAVRA